MAIGNKVVRGNTVEEQLRSIDAVLSSYQRRDLIKKVAVAPCVVPLFGSVISPDAGEAFIRFLSPCNGELTSVYSRMVGRRNVDIKVSVESAGGGAHRILTIGDGLRNEKVKYPVLAGDFITVTFMSAASSTMPAPEAPLDISLSVLFAVDPQAADMRKVLLSEV